MKNTFNLKKFLKEGQYFGPDGDSIIEIIKDRARNNDSSDIDEAMEVMEFIGQHFGIDFEFGPGPSRMAEEVNESKNFNLYKFIADSKKKNLL